MKKIFLIVTLFALSACGEKAAVSVSPKDEARPASVAEAPSSNVSVRDFLVRDEKTPSDFAAYGYLLLSGKPVTDAETKRYAMLCQAYVEKLRPLSGFKVEDRSIFATTYWLLNNKIAPADVSCEKIIKNYDFDTSEKIMSISGVHQKHRGPFIVAWTIPYQKANINTKPRLVLDLSTLTNEDMVRAVKLWKESIAENPKAWAENKLNREVIWIAFLDFIGKYGEQIIQLKPA